MPQLKAIIIGASSGIGRELAKVLSRNNYAVGIAARRLHLLEDLKKETGPGTCIMQIDVTRFEEAQSNTKELIEKMGDVGLFVICAGVGYDNRDLKWELEKSTIDVNVSGFTAVTGVIVRYLLERGSGHLAAISSIAALRGHRSAPAYFASKAYMSNYLQGIRQRAAKAGKKIVVTDIQPGFVRTDMAKSDNLFWMASPEKAAMQIYNAIKKRKKHAYITKRWRIIAWAIRLMPDWMYNKI